MAIVSYKLKLTNLTDGTSTETPVGNVLTYQFTGLATGKTYGVQVKAIDNQQNESAYSAMKTVALVQPPDTTPPSTVANLTATPASTSRIDLAWSGASDNVGIGGYVIERATDAGFTQNYVSASQDTTAITYAATSLIAGTTYFFRVKAKDISGNLSVAWSNAATAATNSNPANPGASADMLDAAGNAWLDAAGNQGTTKYSEV